MEMDEELLLGSPQTRRRRPCWISERACVMIDAAQIIIITITVGARALVADDIIQVKAHTCGNAADDDNNYSTCVVFKSRASKPHPPMRRHGHYILLKHFFVETIS